MCLAQPRGRTAIGRTAQSVHWNTASEVYSKGGVDVVSALEREIVESRREQFFDEHWLDTPGNGRRNVKSTSLPVFSATVEPQYLLTVIEDVTERKEAQARIQHMALHDPLTDLPNRTAFNEHLATLR